MSSEELRRRVEVEGIGTVLRRHRLRWFGHVERKEEANWVMSCTNINCGWGHTCWLTTQDRAELHVQ